MNPLRLAVVGLLAAVLLGVLLALVRSDSESTAATAPSTPAASAPDGGAATPSAVAGRDPLPEVTEPPPRRAAVESAAGPTVEREAAQGTVESGADSAPEVGIGLRVRFVDRNRSAVEVALGVLTLRGADSATPAPPRALPLAQQDALELTLEAPGRYELSIEAEGFISLATLAEVHADRGEQQEIDLILWRAAELPVRVRGASGESLESLAAGFGCAPHEIWSGTLTVEVSREAGVEQAHDAALATYRPAPGHKRWKFHGDVVGTLVLSDDPPLAARLLCMGAVVDEVFVDRGAEQVEFVLETARVDDQLARVSLRVVDCLSGDPIEGAGVTLKAEGSTYRRGEHQGQSTDADGTLVLERIVPERYELTVESESALHQRWITFERAQDLNLGTIELGCGRAEPLTVRIVEGPPEWRYAFVELAPFDTSQSIESVYPGNLHRGIRPGEDYLLPAPEQRSILRAQIPWSFGPQGERTISHLAGSATWHGMSDNLVLDPEQLPAGPIELRLRPVQRYELLVDGADGAQLAILDAHRLRLGRIRDEGVDDGRRRWIVDVTRGSYEVSVATADGVEILRRRVDFADESRIELP